MPEQWRGIRGAARQQLVQRDPGPAGGLAVCQPFCVLRAAEPDRSGVLAEGPADIIMAHATPFDRQDEGRVARGVEPPHLASEWENHPAGRWQLVCA